MLKIITIINWIVIGLLAVLVGAETLFPAKGGDAAGRGIGQAFYYLAIMAFVVLLILNLLPYNWSKYAALGLIVFPFVLFKLNSALTSYKKWASEIPPGMNRDGTPWFDNPQKQRMALAIYDGDMEQVKKLLQEQAVNFDDTTGGTTILDFAISEAAHTSYKPDEKLECVKLMFQAGAKLTIPGPEQNPIHLEPATVGDARLLKFLLEQGADPNARDYYYHKPILFEAISSYKEPKETVQTLLDFGADPNALYMEDSIAISPLIQAAKQGRWNICQLLIQKGADVRFRTTDGQSIQDLIQVVDESYNGDGYSTREDFEQVKKAVQ